MNPWVTSPATAEGWQYVSRAVATSEIISFSFTFPFLSPRKWGQGGLEWDTNERGSVSALTKHKAAHSVSDLYGNTEDSLCVLLDFLGEGTASAQKQKLLSGQAFARSWGQVAVCLEVEGDPQASDMSLCDPQGFFLTSWKPLCSQHRCPGCVWCRRHPRGLP